MAWNISCISSSLQDGPSLIVSESPRLLTAGLSGNWIVFDGVISTQKRSAYLSLHCFWFPVLAVMDLYLPQGTTVNLLTTLTCPKIQTTRHRAEKETVNETYLERHDPASGLGLYQGCLVLLYKYWHVNTNLVMQGPFLLVDRRNCLTTGLLNRLPG